MLKSAQRQSGRRQTAGLHGRAGCPTTRARQHIKGSNADWNGIVQSLLFAICLDSAGCPRALSTPSDDVTAQLYTLFVHSEVQAKRQGKEAYKVVPNCGGPTSEQRLAAIPNWQDVVQNRDTWRSIIFQTRTVTAC